MLFRYLPKKGRLGCPYLPPTTKVLRPSDMRSIKTDGSIESYYRGSLTTAQSLWLAGLPAQALLQLNHSHVLKEWPLPYEAKVWIFQHFEDDDFIGNPVRHYQHLASRVSGPNQELRSWRAWACFHLAETYLAPDHPEKFPRDLKQITKEQLAIPTWTDCLEMIQSKGNQAETEQLRDLMKKNTPPKGDLS